LRTQGFGGGNLGGHDALGVAHAAPVEEVVVFAQRDEGRDGVHVGGKDDVGGRAQGTGVDVPSRAGGGAVGGRRDGRLLHFPSAAGEKSSEEFADFAFVVGVRLDGDQIAGELNGIDRRQHGDKNNSRAMKLLAAGGSENGNGATIE
jgi:hypothetical protein